jgi:hypothetical protein
LSLAIALFISDSKLREEFSLVCANGGCVYQFTKPSDAVQLVRWNKELPSASAADPLGLNLRVSARLANELLHCITSITPRARYYSFFPWAFEDYRDTEHGTPRIADAFREFWQENGRWFWEPSCTTMESLARAAR